MWIVFSHWLGPIKVGEKYQARFTTEMYGIQILVLVNVKQNNIQECLKYRYMYMYTDKIKPSERHRNKELI